MLFASVLHNYLVVTSNTAAQYDNPEVEGKANDTLPLQRDTNNHTCCMIHNSGVLCHAWTGSMTVGEGVWSVESRTNHLVPE